MDEEQKKQIAVFRFGVIADFVTGARMARGDKRRLIAEKSARRWRIPFSDRTRIGASTIRDWIARYEAGGLRLEALYPRQRSDNGRMRRIDDETAANLLCLRQQMPSATVGRLIETLNQRFLVSAGTHLAPTTVWRFLNRHGLMPSAKAPAVDRRKFEAELPNDIWQSDVMHGPKVMVEGRRRKAYLIAFIDDHSRLIPHAAFYLSENLAAFLSALQQAPPGAHLRLPGHRPDPRQSLPAPGQGQGRTLLPHGAQPVLAPAYRRTEPVGPQLGMGHVA
jgi:transposase